MPLPIAPKMAIPVNKPRSGIVSHEGALAFTDFVRHLESYLPLFRQLSEFRLVYVSRTDSHFGKATEIFSSLVKIPLESDIAGDLLHYFRVRKAWDEKQYAAVTDADLIFRNHARARFTGERFEGLYRGWKNGRVSEIGIRDRTVLFFVPSFAHAEVVKQIAGDVRFEWNFHEGRKDFRGLPEVRIGTGYIDQPELRKLSEKREIALQMADKIRECRCTFMDVGKRHHRRGRNEEHRELIHEMPDGSARGLPT